MRIRHSHQSPPASGRFPLAAGPRPERQDPQPAGAAASPPGGSSVDGEQLGGLAPSATGAGSTLAPRSAAACARLAPAVHGADRSAGPAPAEAGPSLADAGGGVFFQGETVTRSLRLIGESAGAGARGPASRLFAFVARLVERGFSRLGEDPLDNARLERREQDRGAELARRRADSAARAPN